MKSKTIDEFHKTYKESNTVELERLWNNVAPKTLIKFYPAYYLPDGSNYSLDTVINKKLWVSSPKLFNDPFDSAINIDYSMELSNMAAEVMRDVFGEQKTDELMNTPVFKIAVQQASKKVHKELSQRNLEIEQGVFVSCFSEKTNINSVCMWAHYANNHSGFCAEYDFKDIKNTGDYGCFPIKYTDRYVLDDNPATIQESIGFLLNLVFTKAKSWKNEKEWRIVKFPEETNKEGYTIDFALPKKIYLGCKVKEKLRKDLCSFCNQNNIPIYQMQLKPGSFYMIKKKIDA